MYIFRVEVKIEGAQFLWNVGNDVQRYTASEPRESLSELFEYACLIYFYILVCSLVCLLLLMNLFLISRGCHLADIS
jgi:hypothetical protein